jgi:hypothetical protein
MASAALAALGSPYAVSGSFTRPADTTAYASGDLVANSTTAGSVAAVSLAVARVAGAPVSVRRVRVSKSGTTATNGSFRVHLYTASPTAANGDNAAWSTNKAADYLGYCDVTVLAFSDGCTGVGGPASGQGLEANAMPATGSLNLYGLLEARAAYTPASEEVFTITAEVWQG